MPMLEPADIPIVIHQGVDWYLPLGFDHADGTTKDTEDWTATFNVYAGGDRTTVPVITLTTEITANGGIEVGIQDGGAFGFYNVLVYMPKSATSALEQWGDGGYDLDLIDPFGHVQRWAQGDCHLEQGTAHGG